MNIFDVVVIGGGPAGMMAAARAAELGARVILLEKNKSCGRKLLMTGNGRCNVTQDEADIRELVKKYKNGPFLFSAFSKFGPSEMRELLSKFGVQTKVEELGRVFPKSDKATDVLKAMLKYLEDGGAEIKFNANVIGFEKKDGKISSVKLSDGNIQARNIILCTGGSSYAQTGSDGAAYAWVKWLGHKVVSPMPALVPLKVQDSWVKELKGLAFKDVDLRLESGDKILARAHGDMLFTHFGVSGPAVFVLSREAVLALESGGEIHLSIDIFPESTKEKLDEKLNVLLRDKARRLAMRAIETFVSARLAPKILQSAGIDVDRQSGQVTRDERERLAFCLKNLKLKITGSMGFEVAMVTSGGVDVKEVDPKTMKSKLISNLFFAGEVLDVDGPTGGYNLQVCWSTGWAAGTNSIN